MCSHDIEYDTCRECGKEFIKSEGTGVTTGFPICDLCPQIEELEMQADDIATDIAVATGLDRSFLFGKLMALNYHLSGLRLAREARL